jgi:DeoR/GlpR family transcriptional regulator of sugar metabolism
MTAQKYVGITRCSKATATRDLSVLLEMGVFTRLQGGGRSTGYALTSMGHSSVRGAQPGDGTDDGLPHG